MDIKSTPLSQDEFECRTHELIDNIGEDVLKFFISCLDESELKAYLLLKSFRALDRGVMNFQ